MKPNDIMTLEEVAAYFKVSVATIKNLIEIGSLPCITLIKEVRLSRQSVEEFYYERNDRNCDDLENIAIRQ
jgi:excisionase family DNA binding protein